eukprot:6084780-Alexandrium_andersonii.AAC.1
MTASRPRHDCEPECARGAQLTAALLSNTRSHGARRSHGGDASREHSFARDKPSRWRSPYSPLWASRKQPS